MPPHSLLHAPKTTRGLSDEQMGLLMATIAKAIHHDRNAVRDYALVRGSYLLGCRVSEIAGIKWKDIEVLSDGDQIHLFGKDPKQRLLECPVTRSSFFSRLAAAKLTAMYFRVPEEKDTSLDRRLEMYAASGEEEPDSTFTHTS